MPPADTVCTGCEIVNGIDARLRCLDAWLADGIRSAAWNGSTLVLFGEPLLTAAEIAKPWRHLIERSSVALVGGSRMRAMLADQNIDKPLNTFLHEDQSAIPADARTVDWRNGTWRVTTYGCDESIGSGCPSCRYACCRPKLVAGAGGVRGELGGLLNVSAVPPLPELPVQTCPLRGYDFSWRDFSLQLPGARNKRSGAHFTWKPELFTKSDNAVFKSRLCLDPPDLVFIDKGYHDSCFGFLKPNASVAEDQLRMFGALLRCLPPPPRTLVVMRTPVYATSSSMCRGINVPKQLESVRSIYQKLHSEGVFGPALLLDGFLLGRTTLEAKRPAPDPSWHGASVVNRNHGWPPLTAPHVPPFLFNPGHYTAPFQDAQWQLLLLIIRALHGGCLKQSTGGEPSETFQLRRLAEAHHERVEATLRARETDLSVERAR
jgi:hypothetical protein